jgi:hypothetical protein
MQLAQRYSLLYYYTNFPQVNMQETSQNQIGSDSCGQRLRVEVASFARNGLSNLAARIHVW